MNAALAGREYDPWTDEAPGRVSVQLAVERYLNQHEGAEATIKSYRTTLEPFRDMLSKGMAVSDVQPQHVKSFFSQPHLKDTTPKAYYNRLRSFFKFCKSKHWIYEDPTEETTPPAEPRGSSLSIYLLREFERIMTAAQSDVILRPDRAVSLEYPPGEVHLS